MPEHHIKKAHRKGVGADLIGQADELIRTLINDKEEQEWAINQVTNEGPEHKQVLNALLLKRLSKFVKVLEKNSGSSFSLQDGIEVTVEKHEHETLIPVALPINAGKAINKEDVIHSLGHAPEHEILVYAMLLQVIEWGIKVNEV